MTRMKNSNPWPPIHSAVAACILDGLTVREAASAIGISKTIVHRHQVVLMDRLHARSMVHLAAKLGAMT